MNQVNAVDEHDEDLNSTDDGDQEKWDGQCEFGGRLTTIRSIVREVAT